MENNKLFKAVERSTQDIPITLDGGNHGKWNIQSQKNKYVNGKIYEVIGVGYTASIDNPDYLLKEDKGNNEIQITALADGTSGTCVLTQNESGNKINLHLTTPEEREYWEIRFSTKPYNGADMDSNFWVSTNISGEEGSMDKWGTLYKNWIVNHNRYMINVHIFPRLPMNDVDVLFWSCLDKNGNAFSPNYNLPDNSYFTTKTTGLGSYALRKISDSPPSMDGTLLFSSRFNPTKKCPLDLNFYLGELKTS